MLTLKRKKKGRDKEMQNKLKEGSNEDKQRNNEIKTKQKIHKNQNLFSKKLKNLINTQKKREHIIYQHKI